MRKSVIVLFIPLLQLLSCEGKVSITEATYQPKIGIQSTLVPGQEVQVFIRRNFALNAARIELENIFIKDAEVVITSEDNIEFGLAYNS